MKIVNLEQFRALPENTLFSKYKPCNFGEIEIKGETWSCDFITQEIASAIRCSGSSDFSDKLFDAERTGESIGMDFNCEGRDGCFDAEQLFAVWEKKDVEQLIIRLQECI